MNLTVYKNRITCRLALMSFCVLFCVSLAKGQSGIRESVQSPGTFFSNVYDRFGNEYGLSDIKIDSLKETGSGTKITVLTPCEPGIFKVYFESGSGMEDIADPDHVLRRAVMCQVLHDISNFLVSPLHDPLNETRINIWVRDLSQLNYPTGIMGVGSSFYSLPASASVIGGVSDGEIWKTIHAGKNSYEGVAPPMVSANLSGSSSGFFYHGMVAIDFVSFNWHTDLQSSPTAGYYDLYSFLLKEMTHALGLASLINSDGTSAINSGGGEFYERYDRFLKNSDATHFLLTNPGACSSMYDFVFNPLLSTSNLAPGCTGGYTTNQTVCATAVKFAGTVSVPVYTPACIEPLFSLGHFEDECHPAGTPYGNDVRFVMSNLLPDGIAKRAYAPEERQALCDIGYSVKSVFGNLGNDNFVDYGTATCPGVQVAGVNDGLNPGGTFTFSGSGPILFTGWDLLQNDYVDPSSFLQYECLEDVYDATTTITNPSGGELTSITVTTSTPGIHLLRYVPIDMISGAKGNVTYVYLYITSDIECSSPDFCNLVLNGGFEDYDPLPDGIGNFTNVCNWKRVSMSTPDYFNSDVTNPYNDVPCNFLGYQTANGNGYIGVLIEPKPGDPWNETVVSKLISPLLPNTDYRISVKVALSEAYSAFRMPFQMYLSPNETLLSGSGWLFNTVGQIPSDSILLTTALISQNGWQDFTFYFNSGNGGQEYLYLGHMVQPAGEIEQGVPFGATPGCTMWTPCGDCYGPYWFIDDVELRPFSNSSLDLPQFICEGQILTDLVQFLGEVSPDGIFSGPGVSLVNGVYVFDPSTIIFGSSPFTITYEYTDSFGCEITLTDEIEVLDADDPQCDCENTLTVNTPQISSPQLYQRHEWIVADDGYEVSGSQDVTMRAGDFIQFNPATSFETDVQFVAYIEDCCEECKEPKRKEEDIVAAKALQLHPNPTKNTLGIYLNGLTFSKIAIVSFDGRLVHEKEAAAVNELILDVGAYADGMYIVNITADDGSLYSEKFIKN